MVEEIKLKPFGLWNVCTVNMINEDFVFQVEKLSTRKKNSYIHQPKEATFFQGIPSLPVFRIVRRVQLEFRWVKPKQSI